MTLANPDIEQIEAIVKRILQQQKQNPEFDLLQRMVRVEEALLHQRELMQQGFLQMEKRFEQVDKRFELMQQEMNRRFEQVDKHFEQVDKRFEQVDKRFGQVDKRLEQQHLEIMAIHQEIKQLMKWSAGLIIGMGALVIAGL